MGQLQKSEIMLNAVSTLETMRTELLAKNKTVTEMSKNGALARKKYEQEKAKIKAGKKAIKDKAQDYLLKRKKQLAILVVAVDRVKIPGEYQVWSVTPQSNNLPCTAAGCGKFKEKQAELLRQAAKINNMRDGLAKKRAQAQLKEDRLVKGSSTPSSISTVKLSTITG